MDENESVCEGLPLSGDMRAAIVERLVSVVLTAPSARDSVAAAKLLIRADLANIQRCRDDDLRADDVGRNQPRA